jgi:methylenetetrahydrofolate dehydrogenase (NADP+)/methenyltetrahydrofolate cyclohydrolase
VTASILDGKATSAQIRSEVAERVQALAGKGIIPGLAAVLVGDDAASRIYVGQKHKASADVGIRSEQVDLPAYVTEHELLATIRRLNRDPEIHGIIVQLPLPDHLPELDIQRAILPEKDVDGLHPSNIGMMVRRGPCFLPATPYGIVELLLRCDVPLEGAEVTIVGYGELVGAPLSVMLTQNSVRGNATVTSTHIRTRDLRAHTLRADILVAAAGVPQLIGADMVRPGATVVDVGVHRTEYGLVGDVRFDEVAEVAGAISPVPGGVGPMTVAMLLINTVQAAEAQAYGRP